MTIAIEHENIEIIQKLLQSHCYLFWADLEIAKKCSDKNVLKTLQLYYKKIYQSIDSKLTKSFSGSKIKI